MLCDGETKLMYFFMVEDGELLKIYNDLWNKFGSFI